MLKQLMQSRGITVRRLSEETGISRRTLEGYIQNRRVASLAHGLALADYFGVDPHVFLS